MLNLMLTFLRYLGFSFPSFIEQVTRGAIGAHQPYRRISWTYGRFAKAVTRIVLFDCEALQGNFVLKHLVTK